MEAKTCKGTAIVPKDPADMSDDITRRIGSAGLLRTITEGELLIFMGLGKKWWWEWVRRGGYGLDSVAWEGRDCGVLVMWLEPD